RLIRSRYEGCGHYLEHLHCHHWHRSWRVLHRGICHPQGKLHENVEFYAKFLFRMTIARKSCPSGFSSVGFSWVSLHHVFPAFSLCTRRGFPHIIIITPLLRSSFPPDHHYHSIVNHNRPPGPSESHGQDWQ